MAKYTIKIVEDKSADWKVATLLASDNYPTERVSINRTNKKGEVFPNFDGVTNGASVEGELWKSDQGKWYLFPQKPVSSGGGANRAFGGAMATKLMDKKQENIRESQENKELGIKTSSTFRMAVDCAIATNDPTPENITRLRQWFWDNWDMKIDPTDKDPF